MDKYQVIKRPLVTEKALAAQESGNRYLFEVDLKATKGSIKSAVEQLFKVKVLEVNTSIVRGKMKRVGRSFGKRPNWKRATVTLKEGDQIQVFEGV